MPVALDRFDTHYLMSPGHVPNLKRLPRDVIAEGRYFHGIDSWERSLEFCVEELGEDMWLFATDWPHGDSAWPEACSRSSTARGSPRRPAARSSATTPSASAPALPGSSPDGASRTPTAREDPPHQAVALAERLLREAQAGQTAAEHEQARKLARMMADRRRQGADHCPGGSGLPQPSS